MDRDPKFEFVVQKVVEHYPIQVTGISLLSYKGKKAVWSVQTPQRELILKKVPFEEEYIRFMTFAIEHLKSNGLRTPGVIQTANGGRYVRSDDEYFVMFECVPGRSPEYEIEEELVLIMRGMAAFHLASQGMEPPDGIFPSILLEERREEYKRKYDRLLQWKMDRSAAADLQEFDRLFLTYADHFLRQCQEAMALLDQSGFDPWVEEIRVSKMLCHQDYASGNLAIGHDGQLYVYDMDSLTVDVPVRDMRKILNKVMKKTQQWDFDQLVAMIRAYQSVHPLTKPQYLVLAADVQFPHLFFGQVSKYYEKRETKWTHSKHLSRLQEMVATELSKEPVLERFLNQLQEVIEIGEDS